MYDQKLHPTRDDQIAMYSKILEGIEACALSYTEVHGSLAGIDCVVLRDTLCKAVEVGQTFTTGRFFGKARNKSIDLYGVPLDWKGEDSADKCDV